MSKPYTSQKEFTVKAEEYNKRVEEIEVVFGKTYNQKQRQKDLKELVSGAEAAYKRAYTRLYTRLTQELTPVALKYVTSGRCARSTAPESGFTLSQHIAVAKEIKELFYHPCKTPYISTVRIKLDRYRDHLSILYQHEYPQAPKSIYY